MSDSENLIKDQFQALDRDGNGFIDIKELETFIMHQGMNIPQEQIQELVEKIDTNQDGKIQFEEFERVMREMMETDAEEKMLKEIFDSIDRNRDGVIKVEELKYALYCLGEDVSNEEVKCLLQFASNGLDYVTFEDFKRISKL